VKIITFTAADTQEEVYQALRAGAHGYVVNGESTRDDFLRCIRVVFGGELWIHPLAAVKLAQRMKSEPLTAREKDVLQLVVAGKSNKEIGSALNVTEGTVKVHLSHIFAKLGVSGRLASVGMAIQRGLANLSGSGPLTVHDSKGKSKHTAA